MNIRQTLASIAIIALSAAPALADAGSKAPHWGSLGAGRVLMRVGPGRNFQAIWEYRRQELPVKIMKSYTEQLPHQHVTWRQIVDPDGATGWVQGNMLSETRTAIVRGGDARPLRQAPNENAASAWRVEAGVVGRVSECGNGWCKLDVKGRSGYLETSALWGVE